MLSLFPDLLHAKRVLPALFVSALLSSAPLHADELILTPSLSLREEYNDNVYALTSHRSGDFITTVSPMLAVSERTERISAGISGGVNSLQYLHNTSSNALGYFLKGAGNYAATQRLSLSTDLGYTRDSSASSIDPSTSLVISSRTQHQSYLLGGRYKVSELMSSSFGLAYSRDDYDSPAYLDTWHGLAKAGVDYDLGSILPRAVLASQVTFSRDVTDQTRVDNLSPTLGLSTELSELWRISLNAGGRFTRSEFPVVGTTGRGTHDEGGAVGSLSLAYSHPRLSGSFALSHEVTSASGRGGATQRTGGSLNLSEQFSRQLAGSLGAGYAWNRSKQNQYSGQSLDERTGNLSGSLQYRIFDAPGDLSLEARYSYNNTEYLLSDTRLVQNIFMLRLNWQHRMSR